MNWNKTSRTSRVPLEGAFRKNRRTSRVPLRKGEI